MTHPILNDSFKSSKGWPILLLILISFIIHSQVLHFTYTNFDDNKIIRDKFAFVGDIKNAHSAILRDAFFNAHGSFYRPVQNLSFMLDAQISRQKLWMFHLSNLLIHILACIALYFFLQMLHLKKITAFYMSVLFAVHPLFASDIGWVPSRGDLLIGLECILLFMSLHQYFSTTKIKWFFIHSGIFFITVFTKETGILLPILLLYYYFFLLQSAPVFAAKKEILKKSIPFLISWCISILFFLCIRKIITAGINTADTVGFIPFLKNIYSIPSVLCKFFLPANLSTLPLFDPTSIIGGVILFILIVYRICKYQPAKRKIPLFGLTWFLLFIIPPGFYRLRNTDVFFNYLEHRSYLPIIGIIIILGFLLNDYIETGFIKKYFIYVYTPVVLLLGILSYIHCNDYRNTINFASAAIKQNNPSAFIAKAGYLLSLGDTTNVIGDCRKAIILMNGRFTPALCNNLGQAYCKLNEPDSAFKYFDKAIELDKNFAYGYYQRGIAKLKFKDTSAACADWEKASVLGYTDTTGMCIKYCSNLR